MSILGALKKYEKMLEDPQNRVSSSGSVKQQTPYKDLGMQDPDLIDESLSPEDMAMFDAVDKRMEKRWSGEIKDEQPTTNINEGRIQKLEKEIAELKDLMMQMMKTHMELLQK